MQTQQKTKKGELSTPDINLLYQIYKYRALSTAQLSTLGNLGKWFVYKKISHLRQKGYICSEPIKGNYILNQSRQGSYHRISGKGITLLKQNNYLIRSTADDLKIGKHRLVYLLTANDLIISLINNGWQFENSRSVKKLYELNRGDILQGTLINPDETKEYALYIFLRKVQEQTLIRIKQEINRNPFEDILIITRGSTSFESVINSFLSQDNKLIKGGGIKVLPLRFAESYLTISDDHLVNHQKYIQSLGLNILGDRHSKKAFETSVQFDYVVSHNGDKKYFMDLLDNDLMKIEEIKRYRKEEYERDGRKVLVLTSTSDFHVDFHKQALAEIQHIEYLTVNPNDPLAFAHDLSNKNVFEEKE